MVNRKFTLGLIFSFLFIFLFILVPNSRAAGQDCCSNADCTGGGQYNCNPGANYCNGNYVENINACFRETCDGAACGSGAGSYTGVCMQHSSNQYVTHSDYCACGCSGGACTACPPTSTCDGSTYPQLCNGGTGVQVCNGKNGTYDPGCDPACSACQSKWSCSGTSCVANGAGSYNDSNCSGACAPPPPGCDETQCSGWAPGGCGAGGCAGNERQQTRSCPGGSTCSTSRCVPDSSCGGSPPPSCGTVTLSVTPNPVTVGNKITITASSAPSGYSDSFTGGFSSCDPGATSTYAVCTTNNTGTFTWTRSWPGGCSSSTNYTINAAALVNNAQFWTENCPSSIAAGTTANVSVSMKNTGTTTWTSAANYRLGSQNPQDNNTWGLGRVGLPSTTTPTNIAVFNFGITAPTTPGTYNFQWRMVQDGVQWFGDQTVNCPITVTTTKTWIVNAKAICSNGLTPYGNTLLGWALWPPTPLTYNYDSYYPLTHTRSIDSSILQGAYVGLYSGSTGEWLQPALPKAHPAMNYAQYWNPPSWMAQWNQADVPSGSYDINYYAPAIMCQIPTIVTPITTPACFDGSAINVSWLTMDPAVSYVDVSEDRNFNTWYYKNVGGNSTTIPSGFTGAQGQGALNLAPNTTYYIRLWNGYVHSDYVNNPVSFSIPICAPAGLTSSCPSPGTLATLAWGPVLGANRYSVSINGAAGVSVSQPTYSFTSIAGNPYTWSVQACNNNGCGASTAGPAFTCAITPWIKTTGGDVHSNTGITAPGGP